MPRRALCLAFAFLALATAAVAAPLRREDVPAPLQPWVDWALHGDETALCATLLGDAEQQPCSWPSRLTLTLDEHGGSFAQQWDVQRDLWLPLPGGAKPWPQEVAVDGAPAVVIAQGGAPFVWLTRGEHTVGGRFSWDRLPEMLPVPAQTGLIELTLRGAAVAFPERDADGRLWLQRREEATDDASRIGVIVHRLVDDDVPLLLDTRIQLEVSGKGREVLLGPALPSGFVPMALDSPLPARLEADGRLRMQVRAGRWALRLLARHDGPAPTLSPPTPSDTWAASEVWVFQAHLDLRLVTIEGADAVDPQQTDLPAEWRSLPAYLMKPGATMQLVERRRGDSDAAPDQLSLERTLWLDFDGGGYTMHDRVSGSLTRAWRLDMAPPIVLGRVAVDGADQFITRLSADAPAGVEIRAGGLRLDADSRLDGAQRIIPAVGWAHDFQSVAGQLQLPPGWRLLHAAGVDQARPTWVATWTLLDLFIVLIAALATGRLFGWAWGALALCAIGLSYTESRAPQMVWLAVLAAEALVRVVPDGAARRGVVLLRLGTLAALVLIVPPFLVLQMRQAIYPALEYPSMSMEVAPDGALGGMAASGATERMRALGYPADEAAQAPDEGRMRDAVSAKRAPLFAARSYEYAAVDPSSVVQTGPGLPGWQWNAVTLEWSGPVDQGQDLHLYLLSPAINLGLAVLRVLLLALLVARLLCPRFGGRRGAAPLTVALLAALIGHSGPARADFPSDEMLNELRTRLLEAPACQPNCAALPRLRLEADGQSLRLRLQLDAAAATAVPLPGQAQHWLPHTVIVDGQPATALQLRDGALWLRLDAGRHDVALDGPLPQRDTVQILLPMSPGLVETQISGWTLEGVHADGVADASLQLSRLAPADGQPNAPLQANQLPPFARIERTLHLGLTWQVQTRVVRLTPPDAALVLAVPLLAGESVTTAEVRVADGKAQINLPPQANEVSWESTLTQQSPIALHAADAVAWVEVWRLDASPIWHVEPSGIAAVQRPDVAAPPQREWRPWPGESVTLNVVRPEGVPGQTLTIDQSELEVLPGLRATDATLTLGLRSSRGAQHAITLPEGAELLSVSIGGKTQPIRQEGRAVVLPIDPGAQRVELRWRTAQGIAARFTSPAVDVGAPSVNAHLRVAVPANRWVLFVGGPRLGPAVLFWSLLPVLLLAALGLGRVRLTPLRTIDWLLLGIGLTQVPVAAAALVAGWLLGLGWRRERGAGLEPRGFDLLQVLLVGWTAIALGVLFYAIQQGLLGQPEMQIAGNGSYGVLRWYQDRCAAVLPQAWVISVPLLVYRLLMLVWALWLAQALLRWLRWGWGSFGSGGYWRPLRRKLAAVVPPGG
ncbi:MAG: hypothetical protein ABI629_08265 [bacterium]